MIETLGRVLGRYEMFKTSTHTPILSQEEREDLYRKWKADERKRPPVIWPFCIDGDEYQNSGTPAVYSTALRKWPQLNDNETAHKVADIMKEQGASFWVACRMAFDGGDGNHICPKCGHEFGDA